MTCSTCARVRAATVVWPFSTRLTVPLLTPAARAMSLMVGLVRTNLGEENDNTEEDNTEENDNTQGCNRLQTGRTVRPAR